MLPYLLDDRKPCHVLPEKRGAMFEHMKFDVEIARNISGSQLYWPEGEEVAEGRAPRGNLKYISLGGLSREEAWLTLEEEGCF